MPAKKKRPATARTTKKKAAKSKAARKTTKKKAAARKTTKKKAAKKTAAKATKKSSARKTTKKKAGGAKKTAAKKTVKKKSARSGAGTGSVSRPPSPPRTFSGAVPEYVGPPNLSKAERAERRKEMEPFRALLLERRETLLRAYQSTRGDSRETGSDGTEDYIDYAVSSYNREFMLSLTEMERKQLQLVEEALHRLDLGIYGYCLYSGDEIPRRRLEVEPWARYTIQIQELEDQGLLDEPDVEIDEEYFDDEDDDDDGDEDEDDEDLDEDDDDDEDGDDEESGSDEGDESASSDDEDDRRIAGDDEVSVELGDDAEDDDDEEDEEDEEDDD